MAQTQFYCWTNCVMSVNLFCDSILDMFLFSDRPKIWICQIRVILLDAGQIWGCDSIYTKYYSMYNMVHE